MMAVSVRRSAMPRNAASSPTGSSSGAMPAPNRSCSSAERAVEAGTLAVELVDEDQAGQAELARPGPRPPRSGPRRPRRRSTTTTARSATDSAARDLAEEVGVAGGVDDVDLDVADRERGQGERDRHVALDLLGLEVAHRRAVVDPALSGDRTGGEEQGLGQRRLARAVVSDQGDVADARTVGNSAPRAPPSLEIPPACDRVRPLWVRAYRRRLAQPGRPWAPEAGLGPGIEGAEKARW